MIDFAPADLAILTIFVILLILIGFFASKKRITESETYFLAGKKVGLFLFVVTNVATWYGGILGIGEYSYQYGLVTWFTQGFPYYIFAIIFAFLLVKKIHAGTTITLPQKITAVYGKSTGYIASLFVFILSSPAPYLLMLAQILHLFFGWPLVWGLVFSAAISIFYLIRGGLLADIYVDAFLFFIMFAGFGILLYTVYTQWGTEILYNNLPNEHLSLTGSLPITHIAVWWIIAVWTFVDPGFHQRVKAAKSPSVAKWGIILSVFLWLVFDSLTNFTGLYARAILPVLSDAQNAYPLLAEQSLGPGLKGLFFAALFATIISTSNSFLFISGTTLSLDVLEGLNGKGSQKIKNTTIGMILSSIVAIVLALLVPSVIKIWYIVGSVCVPGLLIATVTSYFPQYRLRSWSLNTALVISSISTVCWHILRSYEVLPGGLLFVEPMIAGLAVIIIIAGIDYFV